MAELEQRLSRGKKLDPSLVQQLRPEIDRLTGAIVRQVSISSFNRAIDMANAGQLLEAERTLEKVLLELEPSPDGNDLLQRVEKALVAVRARM
jgi:hypothetical protein